MDETDWSNVGNLKMNEASRPFFSVQTKKKEKLTELVHLFK